MAMESVTEVNQSERQLTSSLLPSRENGHQLSPETGHLDRASSLTRVCSRELSESDPLLPNAFCGATVNILQDEPQNIQCQEMPSESIRAMVLQILFPFLLAGFGTVLAGMLLDVVQVNVWEMKIFGLDLKYNCKQLFFVLVNQHWDVFRNVTEIFILVPPLLGLKGNLEMTLASRLSTAVRLYFILKGQFIQRNCKFTVTLLMLWKVIQTMKQLFKVPRMDFIATIAQ